jgi:hypothetical protein
MCPIYSILYYKIKPGKNTNIHGSFEFAFTWKSVSYMYATLENWCTEVKPYSHQFQGRSGYRGRNYSIYSIFNSSGTGVATWCLILSHVIDWL